LHLPGIVEQHFLKVFKRVVCASGVSNVDSEWSEKGTNRRRRE
jgi:hypothetical protein